MADKMHVIVWKSVIVEEWLVEGEKSAADAKEAFLDGACRLISRSEFDDGRIVKIRIADERDFANAEAIQPLSSFVGLSTRSTSGGDHARD
ncbi:hypothetical protein [Shinella sp. JR1-6]|uniref:hypothetical protein n=1 Tax=Shinella sp. JR1-6 TaxID=2527671 RepID=UPI00102D5509|nr:hypothetical protein [Shinella sp. JR1-6]TAA54069.1 hypothetical protein EXZ48_27540 [Shinella sp. JR1-6]